MGHRKIGDKTHDRIHRGRTRFEVLKDGMRQAIESESGGGPPGTMWDRFMANRGRRVRQFGVDDISGAGYGALVCNVGP